MRPRARGSRIGGINGATKRVKQSDHPILAWKPRKRGGAKGMTGEKQWSNYDNCN
jgi:hypothetical protein